MSRIEADQGKYSLNIPYPAWARDNLNSPELDFENWKELQRWADGFNRETISFASTSGTAVATGTSSIAIVRFGGQPTVVGAVEDQFTTAGEIDVYRNGVVFASAVALPTGKDSFVLGIYDEPHLPLDVIHFDVTDAGVGGVGLVVEVWY